MFTKNPYSFRFQNINLFHSFLETYEKTVTLIFRISILSKFILSNNNKVYLTYIEYSQLSFV